MKKTMIVLLSVTLLTILNAAQAQPRPIHVLMVGGGTSHDYDQWYRQEDVNTIRSSGNFTVTYTDRTDSIPTYLKTADVLILTNNQPIGMDGQRAITRFVEKGHGLLLLHAATWYNWSDWPAYNLNYAGGGSKSHERFQEFKNYVVNNAHPITQGVAKKFEFKDELYRYTPDPSAKGVEVLVIGQSHETDEVYPVVFTVQHARAKIAGITLGHDGNSHRHEAYRTLLINTLNWVASRK